VAECSCSSINAPKKASNRGLFWAGGDSRNIVAETQHFYGDSEFSYDRSTRFLEFFPAVRYKFVDIGIDKFSRPSNLSLS
jgi:hypothetical protein